jgi:hypothetical protein
MAEREKKWREDETFAKQKRDEKDARERVR